MKLTEVLSMIYAPKGLTSITAGISQGDLSVIPHKKGVGASLEIAEENIKLYQKQIDECQSDWAYWSILGDLEYWKAVRNILKAAELVGEDNMPEVSFENDGGMVMDAIHKLEEFGELVLKLATEQSNVLICNNCKDIWIVPKDRCDCGCTTLTKTHESNRKYARNLKNKIK